MLLRIDRLSCEQPLVNPLLKRSPFIQRPCLIQSNCAAIQIWGWGAWAVPSLGMCAHMVRWGTDSFHHNAPVFHSDSSLLLPFVLARPSPKTELAASASAAPKQRRSPTASAARRVSPPRAPPRLHPPAAHVSTLGMCGECARSLVGRCLDRRTHHRLLSATQRYR